MFGDTDNLFENVDMSKFESNGDPPQRDTVSGFGASPDGLGGASAYPGGPDQMASPEAFPNSNTDFNIPGGQAAYEPGFDGQYPYGATAGVLAPEDTTPESATRSAGFTVLFVAVAAGIGYAAKGGLGAVTGLLLSGALANGYRAQKWWGSGDPQEKHEAIVSGIFSAGGLAAGGYVSYKLMQEKK